MDHIPIRRMDHWGLALPRYRSLEPFRRVAAIFAAALSSSLNSIAATAVNDLYKPFRPHKDDKHYLRVSHWLTLVWGILQIGVALIAMRQNRSALDQALSIASLI